MSELIDIVQIMLIFMILDVFGKIHIRCLMTLARAYFN